MRCTKKKDDIHHGKILNELSPRKKNFESATNQKTRLDFRSNKFMINLEEVSDESATVLLNDVQVFRFYFSLFNYIFYCILQFFRTSFVKR